MESKCGVCGVSSALKCAKCHTINYCSKEHQKDDWKRHKGNCRPMVVKEDSTLGRHLVASKDIKEGEIISKEKPLVIGPAQLTPPVCLGCYKMLTERTSVPCTICGWPMCGKSCQESPNHKAECDITSARGQKISISVFGGPNPNYQSIAVLRCLYLKKNKPEVWNTLMNLESHCDHRRHTTKWDSDYTHIAQFGRKFFKLENDFSEEEIMKVCGIVQVNAHEVPFTDPPFIAIFNLTSMIEHNCKANCAKSFTDRGEVLITAATDISAGQNLSICYTDPLWGTVSRQHYLLETKFFRCNCERCCDVTEFGTMFSAVKCRKSECTGYLLPKSFFWKTKSSTTKSLVESSSEEEDELLPDWFCNQCSHIMSGSSVQKLIFHVGRDLEAMEKGDPDSCLKFVEHYKQYLHPSHYYLIDVRLALAQLIGQIEGGLPALSDEMLKLKVDLSVEISAFLEKIVPGEIRARGLLLFELHAAIAETGRRRAAQSGEGPGVLIHYLNESKKYLEKSMKLLQHEPKEMPEGKIAIQAAKNLTDMEAVLQNLYSSLDAPM